MTKPIKIDRFKDCVPKKGIWYDHLGTTFISVMRKSKPYVRRKAVPSDNKKDNDLSEWHREWQYDKIELNYGTEQLGVKSYERIIKVNNKDYRIDSLVKKIAIEFQHTLSISLEEMNERYITHSKFGLIPYLVIDLTDFTFSEFTNAFKSEEKLPLKIKLNKWLTSKHSISNRLFIDLKDKMIRVVNSLEIGYLKMNQNSFLENLLELENRLNLEIQQDIERVDKKRKEQIKRNKEIELRNIEKEREQFYHEKFENPDFKFYRFCFANPIIKPFVMPFNGERFEYYSDFGEQDGYLEKSHRYYSKDSDFIIIYKTISKISEKEIQTFRGSKLKRELTYLFAEIELNSKHKTIVRFKRNGNQVIIQ